MAVFVPVGRQAQNLLPVRGQKRRCDPGGRQARRSAGGCGHRAGGRVASGTVGGWLEKRKAPVVLLRGWTTGDQSNPARVSTHRVFTRFREGSGEWIALV